MARIKQVLTERQQLHQKAVEMHQIATGKKPAPAEGEHLVKAIKQDKIKQLWRSRSFRQRVNYRLGRKSLFVWAE